MTESPLHEPIDTEPDHSNVVPEDNELADDGEVVIPNFGVLDEYAGYVGAGHANTDEFRPEPDGEEE